MSDTDAELASAIRRLRALAAPVGPLHGAWDMIFDAEALLDGKTAIVYESKEAALQDILAYLAHWEKAG